ncbi:MAG: hypothetical protein PHS32_17390 [Rhodoferax sp.]|uniref:hypothetical protein n=1 Tax=Rhodoferax sp. TaxID=50421 RepID=UPI00261736CD|nr:hypothetical protein [Rhodoferax sp.]MDD5335508.1 hypothetical protein [Rhodoferax sp.]
MSRKIEDFLLLCKHTGTTMQDQLDFKRDALQVMRGLSEQATADTAYHARCAAQTLVILEEIAMIESYIADQQRIADAAEMLVPTAPAEAPALPVADIDPYTLRSDIKALCKRGVVVGVHPVREKGCTHGIVYACCPMAGSCASTMHAHSGAGSQAQMETR